MKRILLLLLFLPLFFEGSAADLLLDSRFALLPQPQQIKITSNKGLKWSDITYISVEQPASMPTLSSMLDALPRTPIRGMLGVKLILSLSPVTSSPEGYRLLVERTGVVVTASTEAGLFYGCQTLEQLLQDSYEQGLVIPQMEITDYPAIGYRAVHFDTKHHLDDINYYYRTIDKLASYKINAIIWEVEDKLRYTRRPEVASPNAISSQQMQSLSRYAKERHIEISPLIQGLGHASFILKHHWELRENPKSDWEFCPSDERTYELQFDLYLDAIDAMPHGKYLHIGGDEITAIGIDQRCKATGKNALELQMEWLRRVCRFAVEHGRTPIFWDDMPIKNADLWGLLHRNLPDSVVSSYWNTSKLDAAIKLFPRECVYMRWHYEDPTTLPHRLLLDWYKGAGLQVMAATSASTGNDPFMPRLNSRAQYIKDFSLLTVKNGLSGILSTVWDDGSAHWETVMRGLIAQGEFGWNPSGRTVEQFLGAHARREFGLPAHAVRFVAAMEQAAAFFDHALINTGSRNPAWGAKEDFTLIDLPDASNPNHWSKRYRARLDSAHAEQQRYEHIVSGLTVAKSASRRNRYTLEVYDVTARLLHYPVQLLLALEAVDIATETTQRAAAYHTLRLLCSEFDHLKTQLLDVYGQTRFMQNPEGYIADMNHHHHLAALTQNSDWIFLYEIPMTERIRHWLPAQ